MDPVDQMRIFFSLAMIHHQITTLVATLLVKLIVANRRQRAFIQEACDLNMYRHLSMTFSDSTRQCWMRVRSKDWWERVVLKEFTDSEWIENFRMSRSSFMKLCCKMKALMKPDEATVRAPLPLEMRVAIALHKLGTCGEYGQIANQFGVHKSTVKKFVYMFCKSMALIIRDFIRVPTLEEARETAQRFQNQFFIPQVIGCIHGIHIPVLAPSDGHGDFVNRKGWTSYVLQGVVDDRYCFWNISCKVPGSACNANVLRQSQLFERVHLLPKEVKAIQEKPVNYLLLGDPAYPLSEWLIKAYTQSPTLTVQQQSFNAYLNVTKTVVETAFGRLKLRWRVLRKRSDLHYTFTPYVAATCCALHNFCEWEGAAVKPSWEEEVASDERVLPQPVRMPHPASNPAGETVREALTEYMAKNFPLL